MSQSFLTGSLLCCCKQIIELPDDFYILIVRDIDTLNRIIHQFFQSFIIHGTCTLNDCLFLLCLIFLFKKYSPMGDLTDFAAQICDSIGKNTGHIAVVSDRDSIIAVAGAPRRELMDKRCSQELERLMEARKIYRYTDGESRIYVCDGLERYFLGVAAPILSEGDLMGCVMLLLEQGSAPLTESEQKLVQTVAGFLGRQMEN